MEITDKKIERSTLLTAIVILVIIGISLLISTWQTMIRQRNAEEEHLLLTSRSIFLIVESALRRGPVKTDGLELTPRAKELMLDLEREGDLLFSAVTDASCTRLVTVSEDEATFSLPKDILTKLCHEDVWHGRVNFDGRVAYIYGAKLQPIKGRHLSLTLGDDSPVFLLIGIDIEQHLAAYQGVKQNAFFQAVYILVAALFMWILAVSFLARREKAEKAEVLERFQALLIDNLPDGILTLSIRGNDVVIKSANPAALAILEKEGKALLGKKVTQLPSPIAACVLQRDTFHCPDCWKTVETGKAHLEILTLPIADGGKNAFMMILRDRTDLKKLETSLFEAEKLAVIGSLAAGVAHEVRNPLSALRGFAQYFVKKLSGKKPEEEYARTMVREADRLNRVITDLLYLAKPKPIHKEAVVLSSLLDELLPLLQFELEQKAASISYSLEVSTLYADADALKQVFLNLFLNSLEAFSEGKGGHEKGDAKDISRMDEYAPSIYIRSSVGGQGIVLVEVEDNGCGMSQSQREKVFEPFYTGKEGGTGLGLALTKQLMHELGGRIGVVSSFGKGTTFLLEFPEGGCEKERAAVGKTPLGVKEK